MAKVTKTEIVEDVEVEEIEVVEVEEVEFAQSFPYKRVVKAIVEEEKPPHVDVTPLPLKKAKKAGNKKGVIINCIALRLREGANIKTRQLAVIPVDTEVSINLDNSTETFYEVTFKDAGITQIGFCVKDFIKVE